MSQRFPASAVFPGVDVGYRRDIDGLRGIAIAVVVIGHAFPGAVPGGFAGVDVFFVISGFLISRILLGELRAGKLGLRAFYARRARRLFPALAVVLGACLVAGWVLLLPDEFRQLGKHMAAGAGFVSNFAYLNEAGYFDTGAARKPLLHLWSLGIEEQFYFAWPLVLGVVWKARRPLAWMGVGAGASFALSVALRAEASAYYLPFTRCWELLAGCSLAFPWARPRWVRNWMSVGGLALLGAAFALLNGLRAYPGYWALLPVAGALLLVAAGGDAWVNGRILGAAPLVGIGLISYPLYLWHWPLLAFAAILGWTSAGSAALLCGVAAVLAWLTWRYAERPLRERPVGTGVVMWAAGVAAAGVAGLTVFTANGVAGRAQSAVAASELADIDEQMPVRTCQHAPTSFQLCSESGKGPVDAAILGDSHALVLEQGLAAVDATRNWLLVGNPSCPPVTGVVAGRMDRKPCTQRTEAALDYLAGRKVPVVVLAFFGYFAEETDFAADHVGQTNGPAAFRLEYDGPVLSGFSAKESALLVGLRATATKLLVQGRRVVLVVDVPELPFLPRDCVSRPFARATNCAVPRNVVERRQRGLRRVVARLKEDLPAIEIFDPLPTLCSKGDCVPVRDGEALYQDSHHLSGRGSRLVARALLQELGEMRVSTW